MDEALQNFLEWHPEHLWFVVLGMAVGVVWGIKHENAWDGMLRGGLVAAALTFLPAVIYELA